MDFQGSVVAITGAGAGIGRAIARKFAAEGAGLSLCALHIEGLEDTRAECEALGAQCLISVADVSVAQDVEAFVAATLARYARIDVLVNNAGIAQPLSFAGITETDWDRMIDVHLKGTFLCCHAVVGPMLSQGRGSIVNIASTSGVTGGTSGAHYAAAKGGVIAFTKSIGRELAGQGIRVNAVIPSKIDTRMLEFSSQAEREALLRRIPMHRTGKPDEIAEVVAFLASDAASFITGETITVAGGYP